MIEHILRFMTLGTVIVGFAAIVSALYTNNRRLGADIFLKYSERISDLRRRLPMTALVESSDFSSMEITPEERRVLHEIIYSIFELFELRVHGFFPAAVWKIREADVEALLTLPVFRQELQALQGAFSRHPRFLAWIERVAQNKD